jgi:hypothetical protein
MQSKFSIGLQTLAMSALLYGSSSIAAQAPSLGAAQSFAVLGGSTVTNAGASAITGDLGVSPGTAITGFPPGTVTGTIHAGDAVALQAQSDITLAYNALAGAASTSVLTGLDLGGLTLTPGVYTFAASAPLNGVLTLDALGDPNAVFIFQIGSTLLPAINSSVAMIHGGKAENVFWQVGSSATLAAGTQFSGNIVALASITLSVGANVSGRALARTGAVSMDTCHVSVPTISGCGSLASVTDLDFGCGFQVPVLSCTPPKLGQSTTITLTGSQPSKVGIIMATPMGAPVGTFARCPVYYQASSTRMLLRFITDGTGLNTCLHLPMDARLCGTQWTLQAVITSSRTAISVSNTLLCTVGT